MTSSYIWPSSYIKVRHADTDMHATEKAVEQKSGGADGQRDRSFSNVATDRQRGYVVT